MRLHRVLGIAGAALALGALPAAAQEVAGPALSLSAGARVYEGGAGAALVASLRAEYPLTRTFLVEAAGSVADPVEGLSGSTTSALEVQAQAQLPGPRLVPYAGIGAGAGRIQRNLDDDGSFQPFLSVGGGARIGLGRELGMVIDGRVRFPTGELSDVSSDVTLGLRYRFR